MFMFILPRCDNASRRAKAGAFCWFPSALAALALSLSALSGQAQTTWTWTSGATPNTNWGHADNWDQATFPDDATVTAVFPTGLTPVDVNYNWSATMRSLDFQSAGWSLTNAAANRLLTLNNRTDSELSYDGGIISEGTGVNRLNLAIYVSASPASNATPSVWHTGSQNTLVWNPPVSGLTNLIRAGIKKTGAGTLILEGSFSIRQNRAIYTSEGTTLVNTSLITGSPTVSGLTLDVDYFHWDVESGTTLGGTGTIGLAGEGTAADPFRLITVRGTLSPGGDGTPAGGASVGTLTVNSVTIGATNNQSKVVMASGSTLKIDVSEENGVADLLLMTRNESATAGGFLDLTAGDIRLSLYGPVSLAPGNEYTIASFADTDPGDYGVFSHIFYNDVDVTTANLFTIDYNSTSISVTVIPEPNQTWMLLGVGLAALVCSRRRIMR